MKKSIFTLLFISAIAIYTPLTIAFLTVHVFSIPFGASVVEGEFFKAFTSLSERVCNNLQNKMQ